MKQVEYTAVPTLALSVVTAAAAEPLPTGCSARAAVWSALLGTAVLMVLAALTGHLVRNNPPGSLPRRMLDAALCAGFAWELVQTVGQAQWVCAREFSSMALVGLLPLLLWVSSKMTPGGWDAPARVLWWGVFLCAVVYLLGMAGQMQWYPLAESTAMTGWSRWTLPFYAEYFAVARLCPPRNAARAAGLPLAAFVVQMAAVLGRIMLFGAGEYPALELLRAWGMGMFSRLDALLLLLWLGCAVFRIGFLCTVVGRLWKQLLPGTRNGEVQA